jgi:hypothetical protein
VFTVPGIPPPYGNMPGTTASRAFAALEPYRGLIGPLGVACFAVAITMIAVPSLCARADEEALPLEDKEDTAAAAAELKAMSAELDGLDGELTTLESMVDAASAPAAKEWRPPVRPLAPTPSGDVRTFYKLTFTEPFRRHRRSNDAAER